MFRRLGIFTIPDVGYLGFPIYREVFDVPEVGNFFPEVGNLYFSQSREVFDVPDLGNLVLGKR